MAHPSFEVRFAPYRERLFGYAMALTRNRDDAADLFQDCVVRAIGAMDRPDGEPAFRAWLFAILRNLWIDRCRAARRSERLQETEAADAAIAMPVSLESVLVNQLAVRQAMNILSPDHRDVLGLVDIAGFTYEETAKILDVPAGTIMSRVARARKALCEILSDERVVDLGMRKRNTGDA